MSLERWRVDLICCGRVDELGPYRTDSWEDADAFRESYVQGFPGHDRSAIIHDDHAEAIARLTGAA